MRHTFVIHASSIVSLSFPQTSQYSSLSGKTSTSISVESDQVEGVSCRPARCWMRDACLFLACFTFSSKSASSESIPFICFISSLSIFFFLWLRQYLNPSAIATTMHTGITTHTQTGSFGGGTGYFSEGAAGKPHPDSAQQISLNRTLVPLRFGLASPTSFHSPFCQFTMPYLGFARSPSAVKLTGPLRPEKETSRRADNTFSPLSRSSGLTLESAMVRAIRESCIVSAA
mmetsp:Transcript_35897/g.66129  ORF Transcript_35897/g.66129 Transcript_35897/m.66129 type:complete len:230 (-) Transcript_35897:1285-1974(-)